MDLMKLNIKQIKFLIEIFVSKLHIQGVYVIFKMLDL